MEPTPQRGDGEPSVVVTGTIERFTYRNPDNGWAVVRLQVDHGAPVTAVGPLAQLNEGQSLRVTGRRVEHPRFGAQLEVESFEALAPSSVDGITAYLSSGLCKGIGPATAQKITRQFGVDTLRVIAEEPDRLRAVRGLGARKIKDLCAAIAAQQDVQNVLVFLRTHGLGAGLAARIVKRYGKGASALIQANPYRLADEVIGIGFRTADRLAGELGIAPDAPERLQAALLFTLTNAAKEGHCFLPEADLVTRTAELLHGAEEAVAAELPELAKANLVVRQLPPGPVLLHDDPTPIVYPRLLHAAEYGVARRLDALLRQPPGTLQVKPEPAVAWFERISGMTLPEGQRDALLRALREPFSVITGGPGVGKTTIVRALAEILRMKKLTLLLAAPTGRAAKRLEESTKHAASTVHRLLEFQPIGGFARNEEQPLEGHMLVVDEVSMLDIQLADALFAAIPAGMHVVLVGDPDQLPSVGPGSVLADLIGSGRAPVTALTQIFRQQQGSSIVRAAHGILRGEPPTADAGENGDFFFVPARDGAHARELIRELVVQRIPRRFGLDPMRDIQVLCAMYRGESGADQLNRDLQDLLNPGELEVERAGRRFRVGDKIMQTRNDYDREVYNGDVGRISYIDQQGAKLQVRFPEREHEYRFEELSDMVPAYAISVHRSQGSEYPCVVMPLCTEHFLMLKRNLLYTGVTRGKQLVVVVGSRKALELAVRNHDEAARCTGLRERLRDLIRGDGVHPERYV